MRDLKEKEEINSRLPIMSGTNPFRSYLVIPDSNLLRVDGEAPADAIKASFTAAWAKLLPADDVILVIPEVVFGELAYQRAAKMLDTLEKAKQGIEAVADFVGHKKKPGLPTENEIVEHAKKELDRGLSGVTKKQRIQATPIDTIAWEVMIQDAIWRRPPFERGDREKGFRDALILETAKQVIRKNKDKTVVLLSKDGMVRHAAAQQFGDYSHFATYESAEEFVAFVAASRERFSPEFVQRVIAEAPKEFYTADDESTFWWTSNLDEYIRSSFGDVYFNNMPNMDGGPVVSYRRTGDSELGHIQSPIEEISPDRYWKPINELQGPQIGPSKFLGLVGEREFRWQTSVWYTRVFERRLLAGLLGIEEREVGRVEWIAIINWSCKVEDTGTISGMQIQDVAVVPRRIETRRE